MITIDDLMLQAANIRLKEEALRQRQEAQQGSQGSQGMPPTQMISKFMPGAGGAEGAGSGAGPSAGGATPNSGGLSPTGGAGLAGIIAAAIAVQHGLSKKTSTTHKGQETGDAFSGNFMTEPWQGFAYDKLGFKPSAGQRMDAAIKNKDWKQAFKESPEAFNYWANPAGSVSTDVIERIAGEKVANVADPQRWLTRKTFDKLAGLFS